MALVSCSECKKEISSDATACPHCGKPQSKPAQGVGCGTLLIVCFVGFIVILAMLSFSGSGPGNSPPTSAPVNFTEIEKSIKDLIKAGVVIKLNPSLNEVFVSRLAWHSSTFDQKNTLGYVLAHYCGHKKGSDLYWVEIYDANSGKKLAKWSKSWGMKIYD